MRPGTLALAAAVTIGWAGWATAAPIASPSAAFQTNSGVELVRRHHRGHGWGAGAMGASSGLAATSAATAAWPKRPAEAAPSQPG